MKRPSDFSRSGIASRLLTLAIASQLVPTVFHAAAQEVSLTDGNSIVNINVSSQTGMHDWIVDGQDQLNQQWFWFRVGNTGPESSLDSLGAPSISQPTAGSLITTYYTPQFSVQAVYSLVGGANGSGASDLGEQIKIQNLTGAPLTFHFFQYANFSTGGSVLLGQNLQNLFNEALVSGGTATVSENVDSVISPGANHGQTDQPPLTLNQLNDLLATILNDSTIGTNGATWAFEWDRTIAANGTLIISKDLNIEGVTPVPEPSVIALASVGFAGLGVCAWKRRSRRA